MFDVILMCYLFVGVFIAGVTTFGAIYTDKIELSIPEILGVIIVMLAWPAVIIYSVIKHVRNNNGVTSAKLTLKLRPDKPTYDVEYRNTEGKTRLVITDISLKELKDMENLLVLFYDLEFNVEEAIKRVRNEKLKS